MRINERNHRETNRPAVPTNHRASHPHASSPSPSARSFGEVLRSHHERAPEGAVDDLPQLYFLEREARDGGAATTPDAAPEKAAEDLIPVEPAWRPFEAVPVREIAPSSPVPARDAVAEPIIQAIVVAVDAHQRKLLFLRVSVPGRGGVDVRLRRGASGIEVLLSCDDDSLRRDLVARRGELADRGRAANLGLSRIEIAG